MRRILSILVGLASMALPAHGAELARQFELAHGGDISSYGLYDFDYGRLQTGVFGNTCVARLEPGLMYAVSDRLFVGAALQSSYSAQTTQLTQQSRYSMGLAPKISYVLSLNDRLTAIPELTLGYSSGWQNRDNADLVLDRAPTRSQMWATFNIPLLIQPTQLARGSFRPVLRWDVSSSLRVNNGSSAAGVFTPGSHNDAEISCQSTVGIAF